MFNLTITPTRASVCLTTSPRPKMVIQFTGARWGVTEPGQGCDTGVTVSETLNCLFLLHKILLSRCLTENIGLSHARARVREAMFLPETVRHLPFIFIDQWFKCLKMCLTGVSPSKKVRHFIDRYTKNGGILRLTYLFGGVYS